MTLRYAWEQALVLAALRTGEEEGLEARVPRFLSCSKSRLSTWTATGAGECGLRSYSQQKGRHHHLTK